MENCSLGYRQMFLLNTKIYKHGVTLSNGKKGIRIDEAQRLLKRAQQTKGEVFNART